MPLTATNFVNKGPVLHNDLLQFFNLFSGVMTDQPVTFKNVLSVGGSQGNTTVPVKLYGAVGQTSHLIDLYTDNTNANPGWGIGALGLMGWGPGGAAPTDTALSRIATQNGHVTDTPGLLVSPYLEIAGNVSATTYTFPNSATLTGPVPNPFQLVVNQDLLVNRNLAVTGAGSFPGGIGGDVARANLLTNGGFEIWQRGNGAFSVNGGFTADRWLIQLVGTSTMSVSRFSTSSGPSGAATYGAQCTYVHNTSSNLMQQLKTGEYQEIRGRAVSFSASVFCGTSNAARLSIATDGTGGATVFSAYCPGDSTWHTLTVTATVPPDATVANIRLWFDASCTAYIDNAMLVVGSQPADYAPLHPADDLARCLRYYETFTRTNGQSFISGGWPFSTTQATFLYSWKTIKAVLPTITLSGAATFAVIGATAASNGTAISATPQGTEMSPITITGAIPVSPVAGNVLLNAAASATANIVVESNP